MANVLPTLRGGTQQALYPVTRTVSCLTRVNIMWNGQEKRWVRRGPLYLFTLPMQMLTGTDKSSWLTLFNAIKAQLNTDLQLTLGGVTYSNLAFVGTNLPIETTSPLLYNLKVTLRQTRPANATSYAPPTVGGSYPLLACGARAEYPFAQVSTFLTPARDTEYGQRYAFSWYGSGLTNFPTGYLRNWSIRYPLVTDADLATIETFFLGKCGRSVSFDFTDPVDGTLYHNVRFGADDLVITHLTANQSTLTVTLHQTFNS